MRSLRGLPLGAVGGTHEHAAPGSPSPDLGFTVSPWDIEVVGFFPFPKEVQIREDTGLKVEGVNEYPRPVFLLPVISLP